MGQGIEILVLFVILYVNIQLFHYHLLKNHFLSTLHFLDLHLCKITIVNTCVGLFLDHLCSILFIYVSFLGQNHTVLIAVVL